MTNKIHLAHPGTQRIKLFTNLLTAIANENFCPPKVVWPNIIMHRGAINGDRAFVYNVKAHNADDFGR